MVATAITNASQKRLGCASLLPMVFLLYLFASVSLFAHEESYQFKGTHFVASYTECDMDALSDVENLYSAMQEAAKKSGATILQSAHYVFPPNGFTMVILLSESHASIHTYPEHQSCFIDLFTCGDKCSHETFDAYLQSYLKPKSVDKTVLSRGEKIKREIPSR
jgi:S-adenosylmethionine decarboxylase